MTLGTDLTFLVAVAAGLISFLSPCVLPLVPAYLGQLTAVAVADSPTGVGPSRWVAVRMRPPTCSGFGVVFTILGITATFAGGALVNWPPAAAPGRRRPAHRHRPEPGRDPPHRRLERVVAPARRSGRARSLADGQRSMVLQASGAGARPVRPTASAAGSSGTAAGSSRRSGSGDLRDRLDTVHRHHPRRDPDHGRDVRHDAPGRDPAHRLHARPGHPVPGHRPASTTGRRRSCGRSSATAARCRSSAGCSSPAIGVAMLLDWLILLPRYFNFYSAV